MCCFSFPKKAPLWVTFKGQSVTATSNVCVKWVSYPFAEDVGFQPYSRDHAWFPLKKMLSLFLLFCPCPWEFPNIDRLRANSNSTRHVTNNSDIKVRVRLAANLWRSPQRRPIAEVLINWIASFFIIAWHLKKMYTYLKQFKCNNNSCPLTMFETCI